MTPPPGPTTPRNHTRRRGLHAEVVDRLGRMIVTNDPISHLPLVTDDLAERFDVSRTVIREAFRTLESKGLISARPNVGTHVHPVSEWNLLDPDIIEWRTRSPHAHQQCTELHELRWAIETFAARLTARTQDHNTTALLAADAFAMDDALRHNQPDPYAHADTRFHHHLIQASGSLLLSHLHALVTHGLTTHTQPTTCHRTHTSVAHHMTLTHALRHDSDTAEHAMRDLLQDTPHTAPHRNTPVPQQRTEPPGPPAARSTASHP